MDIKTDKNISTVLETYPEGILTRYQEFRDLVLSVADTIEVLKWIEESVKWGELSFRSNIGSPFRFGWNPKSETQFGIYFICTTILVETYKKLYPDFFQFVGNRGLIFQTEDAFPMEPLSHCILMALRYKKVRDLPLLGA
jgi:hypothetical protein